MVCGYQVQSSWNRFGCKQRKIQHVMRCGVQELEKQSVGNVSDAVTKRLKFTDKLLYIYTSGTTGLPKAAVVKNSR